MDAFNLEDYDEVVALWSQLRRFAVKTPDADWVWGYSYIRFSSAPQEEGDSIRRQTSLRDAWLKRNHFVRLDKSLKMVDRAVSGYSGDNRTNPKHGLAQFLALVEGGKVPAGSYLIVENLDRLTRENPIVSIPLVLQLIAAGIKVVQLAPTEVAYDLHMDTGKLVQMLWELARGHGESKRKSGMVLEAWDDIKAGAREGRPRGKKVPAWIELKGDHYELIPERAAVVRNIFLWSAAGVGNWHIVKKLTEQHAPTFGPSGRWNKSYVSKILNDRSAIGEYQPHKGHRKRVPDGEPCLHYYPAVVTEAEFYQARSSRILRERRTGRPTRSGEASSPFAGLLHSALDGEKLWAWRSRDELFLVSGAKEQGRGGEDVPTFPLSHLVDALFSQLREVVTADLFNDQGVAELETVQGQLRDVDRRLAAATAAFEADPESPEWSALVTRYSKEKRSLVAKQRELAATASNPVSEQWSEAVCLMRENDPTRLRQCLLATVESVWCVFLRRGYERLAAVQVFFVGGEAQRSYLIYSFRPQGHVAKKRRPRWVAKSLREAVSVKTDLRDRKQAAKLEKRLQLADWSVFAK